jgi:hypothetical protein
LPLKAPPKNFNRLPLDVVELDPAKLFRISKHDTGEPYFGRSGGNRFDDNRYPKHRRFGACYFGLTLSVAFAETVLHDEMPEDGYFNMAEDELESRYVVQFAGAELHVADMTGRALRRLGADGSLSTEIPYQMPQRWSRAVHRHPAAVDGFIYMSRHLNNEKAVVLYDRAAVKLQALAYTALPDFPGALRAAMRLSIRPK